MIVDLDSHLREEYFLDEVYKLEGSLARFTPVRVGNGKYQEAKFIHNLNPTNAKVSAVFDHSYMYDPKRKWRGGETAERQVGGYDMERRLEDMAREEVEKQLLFPTLMSIPATNYGALERIPAEVLMITGKTARVNTKATFEARYIPKTMM